MYKWVQHHECLCEETVRKIALLSLLVEYLASLHRQAFWPAFKCGNLGLPNSAIFFSAEIVLHSTRKMPSMFILVQEHRIIVLMGYVRSSTTRIPHITDHSFSVLPLASPDLQRLKSGYQVVETIFYVCLTSLCRFQLQFSGLSPVVKYPTKNLGLSVCLYACMDVCPSDISRTIHPIYFTLGRCVAVDIRVCNVKCVEHVTCSILLPFA